MCLTFKYATCVHSNSKTISMAKLVLNQQQGRNLELKEQRTAEDTISARILARRQCMYPGHPEASEANTQWGREVRCQRLGSANKREG